MSAAQIWSANSGTTSAPRWPHCVHTMPLPSVLITVSSGKWPTFIIAL